VALSGPLPISIQTPLSVALEKHPQNVSGEKGKLRFCINEDWRFVKPSNSER
jgi:hypothetical protein